MTPDQRVSEHRGRAMGSGLHLIVVTESGHGRDPMAILRACRGEVERLEGLWSRFLSSSDISMLNRSSEPELVAPETRDLLRRAIEAWHRTGGRFDPTLHNDLVSAGYDRDLAAVLRRSASGPVADDTSADSAVGTPARPGPRPASTCGSIEIDPVSGTVLVPGGTTLDAGGIGKGLAADRVAALAMRLGAVGALVNLGGDLRCRGRAPDPAGWSIEARAEPGGPSRTIVIADGGVATSSCLRRRWRSGATEAHHLIEAVTGRSRPRAPAQVTVVAATAAEAETVATAVASSDLGEDPSDPELASLLGAGGALVVDRRGVAHHLGSIEAVLR